MRCEASILYSFFLVVRGQWFLGCGSGGWRICRFFRISGGSSWYSQAILSSNTLSFWFLRAREFSLLRALTIISRFDFWGFGFGFLRAHNDVAPLSFVAEGSFVPSHTNDSGVFSFIRQDRRGARMEHLVSRRFCIYYLDPRLDAKSLPG